MTSLSRTLVVALAPLALLSATAPAQTPQQEMPEALTVETFATPPAPIAEAVLAPRHENRSPGDPSPHGRYLINEIPAGLPTQADFAKPFFRLAGQQVDPRANRDRRMTTRGDIGLEIVNAETGTVTAVQVPRGARVSSPQWSPDGSQLGFFVHTDDATHIYVAIPATGRSRQVTPSPVLATLYRSFAWTADSRNIVTVLLPANRGRPPAPAAVPTGPQVRHTTPETNRIRTHPDLLENPYEHELLAYYNTGQLAIVTVQNRRARRLGTPAMISDVEVSPDGAYALVSTTRRPFSYIAPAGSSASAEEVWSLEDGAVVALVSEQEVRDGSPSDTTNGDGDPEKRNVAWRPDGQGLSLLQAVPRRPGDSAQADTAGGGGRARSERGDRVMQWLPPFDSTSVQLIFRNTARLAGVRYSEDAQILFLTEQTGENVHEYAVFLDDPDTKHTIFRGERQGFGRFGGGPRILTRTLPNGVEVVRVAGEGEHVFLMGVDYAEDPEEEGPISYVERVTIRGGEKERVYESENDGVWERAVAVLDDDITTLLVSREGPTDVPDTYVRSLGTGDLRQLTENVDHTPDLTNAQRRRYQVTRVDGFTLALNVTLPQSWQPGQRLPGMIWFYPREYTDQDDYNETLERYNINQFHNIGTRSMEILVRHGYVVIQPDAPIVGETGRMNDNYVNDLRNNLAAVIDFLDSEGVIDRHRLGVGGHSYGAFGTANAMVHTPFFKAGIAGDGNYNRTLTPFSFQSERRTFWQSKDTYFSMSPLFFANHLNGALLMYHGADDQNVGTFPIHSWRMFEALEALGKTASLYVYPYEEHGPATRETLLDLWARWTAWLDRYVKHAGQGEDATTEG